MTSNDSESLNNMFRIARQLLICAIIENPWHKCVEWFYKRREVAAFWEAQGLIFSHKVIELINITVIRGELTMSYHWIGVSTTTMFTTKMDLSRR
jgi:hypothetical protein